MANTTVRGISQMIDQHFDTVHKILLNNLPNYQHNLSLVLCMLPTDLAHARWGVDTKWPRNILWKEEAHFHLYGGVNMHQFSYEMQKIIIRVCKFRYNPLK